VQQRPAVDIQRAGVTQLFSRAANFELLNEQAVAGFKSSRLNALYGYWCSRQNGQLPKRVDIEPADIKSLLPYILIVDIEQNPFRVFYRLVGTAVAHFSGMDFTSTYLDDLAFDICARDDLVRAYRSVCEARRPGRGMAFPQISHPSALDVEYLICPLVNDADAVVQCLVIEDYVPVSGPTEAQDSGNLRGRMTSNG
jgi:hypothetical protein